MKISHLFAAAAATALVGGAACAQNVETSPNASTAMPDQAPPAEAPTPANAPSSTPAQPAAGAGVDAAATTTTDASATPPAAAAATVSTITNGPVPDTPANRALYKPLSRAGMRTAAAGN